MNTEYVQLRTLSKGATALPAVSGNEVLDEDDRISLLPEKVGFGQARSKPICDWIEGLTLVCTFSCLAISIIVIDPRLPYAWRIGYNNQLIVLGFMLAVMNLCNRRIATRLFVIIEARWGGSRLQNFDAILRQSIFVRQTSFYWIGVFLLSTTLPLALGVAYKSFINGSSSQPYTAHPIVQYGYFDRPYERGMRIRGNSAREAMMSFLNMSYSDDEQPRYTAGPQPFGYNHLLINNETYAILDMPNSTILAVVQESLGLAESLLISADVQGTVAVYNKSSRALLDNDNMWDELHFDRLHTTETYADYRLGISFSPMSQPAYVWIRTFFQICGVLPPPFLCNEWYEFYGETNNKNVRAFRSSDLSLLFDIHRRPCSATWNVTSSAITLKRAVCTDVQNPVTYQNDDGNMGAGYLDVMDTFVPAIANYLPNRRYESQWRVPSHAMLAATAYWNRWIGYGMDWVQNETRGMNVDWLNDFRYRAANETKISTRLTLAAWPGLYVVLVIQPVLTVSFLILTIFFYSTPVDSGFGLTSILASIDGDSLHYLRGAGLSGMLTRPLHLSFEILWPSDAEHAKTNGIVASRIGLLKESRRSKLRSGAVYG